MDGRRRFGLGRWWRSSHQFDIVQGKTIGCGRTDDLSSMSLCSPVLERFQQPGSDRNQWDFHKCMNVCLGR
jgi:hypothetical protein